MPTVTKTTKKPAAAAKKRSASPKPKPVKKTASTASPASPASPAAAKKIDVRYIVARACVFNIINNARYVLEACKCKTVMPAHLKAISMIQATISKNNIGSIPSHLKSKMSGGDPVMASEFYGVDSGRYLDISQVQNLETHMFADSTLSRAEMPIKMGGAAAADESKHLVSTSMVKKSIKEMREAPKVSKEALEMLRVSAELHVKDLQRALGKEMTLEQVRRHVAGTNEYVHLRNLV